MIVEPSAFVVRNDVLFRLVGAIIQPPCDAVSFLRFGQAVASTLPTSQQSTGEGNKSMAFHIAELELMLKSQADSAAIDATLYAIYVRNRLLNIVSTMLAHSNGAVNQQYGRFEE